MKFADIRGQERPVKVLKSALSSGRLAHAYLFYGPEGVGKGSVALIFAKALNCPNFEDEGDVCDRCRDCYKIEQGVHPDVRVISPTGAGRFIKIDAIRELQHRAYLAPFEGRRKVFIIDEAERMGKDAANAFLKILEEPPSDATFVLVSHRADALLPTIRSRCQMVKFSHLRHDVLSELLGGDENAQLLARIAGGSPGEARRLAQWREWRRALFEALDALSVSQPASILAALAVVEEALAQAQGELEEEAASIDDKEEAQAYLKGQMRHFILRVLEFVGMYLRDLAIAKALVLQGKKDKEALLNQDMGELIWDRAKESSWEGVIAAIRSCQQAKTAIARNANQALVFRTLFLKLAGLLEGKFPPEELSLSIL